MGGAVDAIYCPEDGSFSRSVVLMSLLCRDSLRSNGTLMVATMLYGHAPPPPDDEHGAAHNVYGAHENKKHLNHILPVAG